MSVDAALVVNARVSLNKPFDDWCLQRFGRLPNHRMGYGKERNANKLPCVSYVPVSSKRTANGGGEAIVSVVFTLIDQCRDDDINRGFELLGEAEELFLAALVPWQLSPVWMWDGTSRTATDLGLSHPVYESEVTVKLLRSRER